MHRRPLLLAALAAAAGPARAQAPAYPNRPIRVIIPWPPGQATDLAGRLGGQALSERLGVPVVAENRAGAGGMIGTDAAAKAAPDGYTLLAGSSGPVTINPLLQRTAYDVERDLATVGNIGLSPYVLATKPDFPATDARSFVERVKREPGKFTFASSGTGATAHLITEFFNRRAGLDAVHVPFAGSGPALTAVVAGQVDYAIDTVAAIMPLVRANSLRAYGVTLERGTSLAPELPPLARALDLPGFDAGAWIGLMAPSGVPAPILAALSDALVAAISVPEWRARIANAGLEPDPRPAAAMAALLREQRQVYAEIIRSANIRLER